jgi:hypothetical protein
VTALTLALWVKSDVTGTDKGVFISEDPSSGSDNILALRYDAAGGNGGGTNVIKASVNVSGTSGNYESAQNVQTTSWQHLTLTWSSGNQLALYIDGNLDTPTFNSSARTGTLSNATKLLIGKGTKDASAGWDGQIDDVRLYDRVLSQAEITALAASAPTACAAAPTVTSVAPTSGPDTGGTAVTITGTGFPPPASPSSTQLPSPPPPRPTPPAPSMSWSPTPTPRAAP